MAAIMEWFKLNGYNYMYGSLRLDTPIQRLVFVELLALASISRVRRTVCLSEGIPYPRSMLAGIIGIPEEQLNEAITHHINPELGRLALNEWGGIEVIKWDKYQSESYDRVRKYREKKRQNLEPCNDDVTPDVTLCNADVTESVTPCNGREENRKEEKRIEETKENKDNSLLDTFSLNKEVVTPVNNVNSVNVNKESSMTPEQRDDYLEEARRGAEERRLAKKAAYDAVVTKRRELELAGVSNSASPETWERG